VTHTATPRLVGPLGIYVVRDGSEYYAEIVDIHGRELARLGPEDNSRDAETSADQWVAKHRQPP